MIRPLAELHPPLPKKEQDNKSRDKAPLKLAGLECPGDCLQRACASSVLCALQPCESFRLLVV
eukprot:9173949-Pyramimonas_sp.AAC.1